MTANPLQADKNCTQRLLSWQYISDMYPETEELVGYYEETKTKLKQKENTVDLYKHKETKVFLSALPISTGA